MKHWVGRVAPTKEALKNKVRFPSVSQAPKIGVGFQVHSRDDSETSHFRILLLVRCGVTWQ